MACFPYPLAATIATTLSFRSEPVHSIADGIPGDRARDSDLEKAKTRVDNVAAKRCLIENTDETNALDYVHLLAWESSDKIVSLDQLFWPFHDAF